MKLSTMELHSNCTEGIFSRGYIQDTSANLVIVDDIIRTEPIVMQYTQHNLTKTIILRKFALK